MNINEVKRWINDNLVMRDEARKITGQSQTAFNQAVQTGRIQSFVEFGDARVTRLYLREDLEKYAENKREQRGTDNMSDLRSLPKFEFEGKTLSNAGYAGAKGDTDKIITHFYTDTDFNNLQRDADHYDITWDLTEFLEMEASGVFEWPFPHAVSHADVSSYEYFTRDEFTPLNETVIYGVNELILVNHPVRFSKIGGECRYWGGAVDKKGNHYKVYWNMFKIIEPSKIIKTTDKSLYCKKCLTYWSLTALESTKCAHEWAPNN